MVRWNNEGDKDQTVGLQMDLKLERIESVAPDLASLKAAKKLLNRNKWPALHQDADGKLIWGECQGSGSQPYRMAVDGHDLGAKCSCPSRKFPCKHSLALMWWRAEEPASFVSAVVPDWVNEWLSRRRSTATTTGVVAADEAVPKIADIPSEPQEKDVAKAAAQRAKNRDARETSILRGLDELDRWVEDQLDRGLAAFATHAVEQCRVASQRLADAKAPGLASRVDELPHLLFATDEAHRHNVAAQALGGYHLLAQAYRRQDQLDGALRSEVRRLVGWTTRRADLLEDPEAPRVTANWVVIATRREVQPDRLMRLETWLVQQDQAAAQAAAVLMDFVPVAAASASGSPFTVGQTLAAELVFYPSATPLSANVAVQETVEDECLPIPVPSTTLAGALAQYDECLAANPWLPRWPLGMTDITVRQDQSGAFWVVDGIQGVALPTKKEDALGMSTLAGLGEMSLYGLYDGQQLLPMAAMTSLGPWWNQA